ncbi:MAG: type II secretion system F family protein [Betaproteobacteria bacterium]|nr:MAG: type II secretion system F family protein [Betaproteobacteria bacterium]
MALYSYRAVNAAGDVAAGELDAANESEILERLRDRGLMPMQVVAAVGERAPGAQKSAQRRSRFASRRVTRDNVLAFTRELATLLGAGLPLDRALEILIGLAISAPVAALLQSIRDSVRGGKSLSQSLDMHRDVFSRFYVNIVRAGEAGGALGAVLTRLAETMERNKELRDSVLSALIYPTILILVAVASIMVLLVYVVPTFQQTFAQAGKALPLPTQVVIFVGTGLRSYWWLLLLFVTASIWLFRRRLRRPAVRFRWDQRLLRWPLIGDLVAKVEVARFARTLATLLTNGVTLLSGLSIVKETMTNTVLANALDGVVTRLREGKGFGRPLIETGIYPRLATQLILVGEESGRLEEMLGRVADVYDREVAISIKRFLAVLEPVLILTLALFVLAIVLSILMGIVGMSELVV